MPSVAVKLYSVFFKFLLKHRLQNRIQGRPEDSDPFGVTTRPDESVAPANPSFSDGVATKDIHIDPLTSLSIRIFLPDSALEPNSQPSSKPEPGSVNHETSSLRAVRRNSYEPAIFSPREEERRNSGGDSGGCGGAYRGYAPSPAGNGRRKKLPVVLQFHGGGWVSGSNDSVANDVFCRRVARLCEAVVVAVGYRLAPENRYPAAFEDGLKVLNWLAKQANLAECTKSMGGRRRLEGQHKHIVETFGASVVEPWLAAHGNPSRNRRQLLDTRGFTTKSHILFNQVCSSWRELRCKYCRLCGSKSCRNRHTFGPCQGSGTGPDVSIFYWKCAYSF
uniref:Alpha/beta hydrolase fold-3 domain-containing protein n=1 Tax=Glycine max TaxID=3847 RepID=A0A0R0EJ84_SOYBN